MNKNKIMKFRNNNNNQNNTFRRQRGRKKRRIINSLPPSISQKPSKYGPGMNLIRITFHYNVESNTLRSFYLGENIRNNIEFQRCALYYKYFKLKVIKIFLPPYNMANSSGDGTLLINWDSSEVNADDMRLDDRAKYFGPVNSRFKIWKFLPPHAVAGTTGTNTAPVLLDGYINDFRFVLPLRLHIIHYLPESIILRVELVLLFRGNEIPTTTSLKTYYINLLKQLEKEEFKIGEDNKEEEHKENLDEKDKEIQKLKDELKKLTIK